MSQKKILPAVALAVVVLAINVPILKYPLSVWAEPREILAHTLIVVLLYMALARHFSARAAFLGSLGFGIFPSHALTLAEGSWSLTEISLYVMTMAVSVGAAMAFDRFYGFLKTQEKVVLQLFITGVGVLFLWMAVVNIQTNAVWADEVSLARWRAQHVQKPWAINHLADLLRRQDEYIRAQKYYRARLDLAREHKEGLAKPPDHKMTALVNEISGLYKQSLIVDPRQVQTYYGLAEFYLGLGRGKEAMGLYKNVLAIDPKRRDTYFYLAQIYEDLAQPNKAIEMYNQVLKLYPEDEAADAAVVDAYGRAIARHPEEIIYQEKREEALASYEQLSKRKKYTANDYFNLGFLYEQVGGYEEAVRFYHKALGLAPTHEKALYNLANRYQAAGDVKTALVLYSRLVHYHPKFTFAYLNMGLIYNALGDTARARSLYQKLISIDPGNADGYFNLGYLSESAGELREALSFYEKAVESDPKHAEAYYNMGNVYATLQQYPEAIASYLKTVAINPNHQNAFVNLSILSFKSQDFTDAIHYLEEARLLGYNPPDAYLKTLEPYRKK